MSAYIEPLKTALIIFPILALFISSFFFIYQYRKYGTFILSRAIILYSFIFYLLCTYFLVILPLPSMETVAHYQGPRFEWRLGASAYHFLTETVLDIRNPATYLPALKQNVFLEPLFNVLLLVPFGVYLRYYFNFSFKKTILASFLLSLFFELTQLTGLYFIYPRNYRLADVNDLLHNTLGGALGYLIEPILTFVLPTREAIDEKSYAEGQKVSLLRRGFACGIDWTCLNFGNYLLTVALRLVTGNVRLDLSDNTFVYIVEVLLYFVLLNYLCKGQTLGKKLVAIRVQEVGHQRVRLLTLLKRYSIIYFFYFGFARWAVLLTDNLHSNNHFILVLSGLTILAGVFLEVLFVGNVAWSWLRKKHRLFYERATQTYTVSTIKPKT